MRLVDLISIETGVDFSQIMLLRHFNTVDRLIELGGSVDEFTSLQPTGSKYDYWAEGKHRIKIVAVIVHDYIYGIYRVLGIKTEGTTYSLTSKPHQQFDTERKKKDRPARRFDMELIPSSVTGTSITGWKGREISPVARSDGKLFWQIEVDIIENMQKSDGLEPLDLIKKHEKSIIENLTKEEYKEAFVILQDQMTASDIKMLELHYRSPRYDITAAQLAKKVDFSNLTAVNLRYGLLANKFLEFFQIDLTKDVKLNVLISLEKLNNEWHWKLRPHVVQALEELEWFPIEIFQQIEQFKASTPFLDATTREAIIQSRIGQGKFRTSLVDYWKGCSVSGCKQIRLLKASHIKPWHVSSNEERLNVYNGLLLLPNLDSCFDLGFVSFDDEGKILLSSQLEQASLAHFGINSTLKLLRLDEQHKKFLRFHRENIFRY